MTTCLLAFLSISLSAADLAGKDELSKPDGQGADMSKPVKVFLIMGQSNAVGLGRIKGDKDSLEKAVTEEKLYPFLVDAASNWTERNDVRNVFVEDGKNDSTAVFHNEWLKVGAGKGRLKAFLGIEFGVGHQLGNFYDDPVMLLKSCSGNRSLGWDLLPPGSRGYDFSSKDKTGKAVTYTYAAYHESPMKWIKGTAPQKIAWYAGLQYDHDVANAKKVLAELDQYYPGARGYEVAGIFWWQGEKDAGDAGHAAHYEENLVRLIKTLRQDFHAPNAKFVIGTLGEAAKGCGGNEGEILEAMLAVDGKSGKYPEFKGNVATVYTHDLARGSSGNAHYGHNAKVYMDVGLAMGEAMVELLQNK